MQFNGTDILVSQEGILSHRLEVLAILRMNPPPAGLPLHAGVELHLRITLGDRVDGVEVVPVHEKLPFILLGLNELPFFLRHFTGQPKAKSREGRISQRGNVPRGKCLKGKVTLRLYDLNVK